MMSFLANPLLELELEPDASCNDILPMDIRNHQDEVEPLETKPSAIHLRNDITFDIPPKTFLLETKPNVRKVGVKPRAGSDLYEVMRGQPIHFKFPRDFFTTEDYVELSVRHGDSRYWHYPENRIHACRKHNLYADREKEKARFPLKVLEHPSDQISYRIDDSAFILNINELANKEYLVVQFACCGRESHNKGDDTEARTWALHINGTTKGLSFETKLELQVYTTMRERVDQTRKRKLNQPTTIMEEIDLPDEEIRKRYKKWMDEVVASDLKYAPITFLKYQLDTRARHVPAFGASA